ncbi:MAG: carboxypeptidase regulatory-like domain-containing protein [Acidobacteria bacterium]|nr:carboxypeptidase regulatory-like domain-containing protein [Acidobacteriota bacterium]
MNKTLRLLPLGALVALAIILGIQLRPSRTGSVEASEIAEMGTLSGKVEAPKPFQAARVYAKNLDKNILYMVYTSGGLYRAMNLFPGNYEVTVKKSGFAADGKKVIVKADQDATVNLTLREAEPEAVQQADYPGTPTAVAWDRDQAELVSYESLYPPGSDYELVKKTCLVCHGINFFPSRPSRAEQWNKAIDLMSNPKGFFGLQIPPGQLSSQDRERIVAYLTKNFGPDKPKRALKVDLEMPLDEEALAKAMYVEYDLPLDPVLDKNNRKRGARDPHVDRNGNVWYTDISTPNRIGRLDPRTATFQDFVTPDPTAIPHGVTVDAQGDVWWTDDFRLQLGRLNPKTGKMVLYPTDPKGEVPGGHGYGVALDSQQNVWFSMSMGSRIGKWDRKTQQVNLWEPPTLNSQPMGVLVDRNDKIWFPASGGCRVGKFDPITEKFAEYPALTQPCKIAGLALDSKGVVWYSVTSGGKLGRLDPTTGERTEYEMPTPFSVPYALAADPDGNVWISDGGQGGALVRFNPQTKAFTYYPTPEIANMPRTEITRQGAIWYAVRGAKRNGVGVLYPDVARITALAAGD